MISAAYTKIFMLAKFLGKEKGFKKMNGKSVVKSFCLLQVPISETVI